MTDTKTTLAEMFKICGLKPEDYNLSDLAKTVLGQQDNKVLSKEELLAEHAKLVKTFDFEPKDSS